MQSVVYGAQSIALGLSGIVVAGGFESMSNVPHYLNVINIIFNITQHRKGMQFGNSNLVDGLAYDGLTDVYNNIAMGLCAEKTVSDLKLTRELQDDYTISSYERTLEAIRLGKLA